MNLNRNRLFVVPTVILVGCTLGRPLSDDEAQRKMLALLMPSRIQIVEPFTQVRSVNDEGKPDTVELLIQAVNSLDDPGLTVTGTMRVELYEFVPASGNERGKLLEHWDIDLTTAKQQKLFWNQLTQMYEFRLGVDPDRIPRATKYVLAVTYNSPLGDRLSDEYVLSPRDVGPQTTGLRIRPP